jgi:hypothetical protein
MSTVDKDADGYATVEALTTGRLGGEDYVIASTGQKVRIQALSRAQVLRSQELRGKFADMEVHALRCAIVRPKMNDAQVRAWLAAIPAGEIEALTRHLNAISGMGEGADTQAYEQFRDGPGNGVRSLPGGETVPDGSGDPSDR